MTYTQLYSCTEIQFQFTQTIYNVREGDGFAIVTIELISGFLAADAVISLATSDGMANNRKLVSAQSDKLL